MSKKKATVHKSSGAAARAAEIRRKTKETDIRLTLNLDGAGRAEISTGVGFFDHMLTIFAKHACCDLTLQCRGDLEVDAHHSVEDAGLALGEALAQALGDKAGIRRFGFASVPLDEALAQTTVDLSGRPFFVLEGRRKLGRGKVGGFDAELTEDFFGALAAAGKITLHVDLRSARNAHHAVEAVFKSCARALRAAVELDPRASGVPSTKGVL
jgi:imidazoleglycerol-phosphate dehydratase